MTDQPKKPMTKSGFNRLYKELRDLMDEQRPALLLQIADAAAEGDRSENAEYIYGRKKLREMDKRIRYLSRLLDKVTVLDPVRLASDQVGFGATVTVLDEDGVEHTWTIVGEGEAMHDLGQISWVSPVARALRGKRVGAEVLVDRPKGAALFEILQIEYGE